MASRKPGGYAVTPLPGGRDFHPHQISVIKVLILVLYSPAARFQRNVSHSNLVYETKLGDLLFFVICDRLNANAIFELNAFNYIAQRLKSSDAMPALLSTLH